MRAGLLFLSICAFASVAAAQDESRAPSPHFPDRALALRPAGLAELVLTYAHGTGVRGSLVDQQHHLAQGIEVRVPYESLVVDASWTGIFEHYQMSRAPAALEEGERTLSVYSVGSPRLGASFRDQVDDWRYEIGGAIAFPTALAVALDRRENPYSAPPISPEYATWIHRGGWSWFQRAYRTVALVARARAELDVSPEAVVGADLELPVAIDVARPHVKVTPQIAVEGAWRFVHSGLLGLRAQLVVVPAYADGYDVVVGVEPFLRIAHLERDVGFFGMISVFVYLGPAQLFSLVDPLFSVQPRIGGGVLF